MNLTWKLCFKFCKRELFSRELVRVSYVFPYYASSSYFVYLAIKAYNRIGNHSTAFNLSEVLEEEDLKLACGHIALNIGDFDLAEKSYLLSSEKEWALSMRCDLHQWEDALELAVSHAPFLCAGICLKYAESEEEL